MRLKCIACDALARPIYLGAAMSCHVVDVVLESYGQHINPVKLREILQSHIDACNRSDPYDAIVLAYGLCGKATEGITARHIPVVIPKAHDCITLFLGDRVRYTQAFTDCPGTYWFVQDYIERANSSNIPLSIGANTVGDEAAVYAEFVQKFGEDNADYLMTVLGAWKEHYQRAVFIDLKAGNSTSALSKARDEAQRNGWRFERMAGDIGMLVRLLNGEWERDDFLVLQPGQQVEMTGGDEIIHAVG